MSNVLSILFRLGATFGVAVSLATAANAQTEENHGPGHPIDETHERTQEASRLKVQRFNPLKNELNLFGHTRQRGTYLQNNGFGEELEDGDWFYTHRYFLGGEYKAEHFRVLGELSAAFVEGSDEGISPVEQNELAVQRLWFEADLLDTGDKTLAIRVGRDEWKLGSQRLVGWRDGTNVRRRFDGVRLFYHDSIWDAQLLAGFEVENDTGIFDDDIGENRALWGVYATRDALFGLPGKMDLYYLGFFDERARAVELVGEETRHSIGTRLWGREEGWDWNVEAVYQFGDFTSPTLDGSISAWTVASITGYTFEEVVLKPRIALSANIASGDSNDQNSSIGGFNALFPRGSYFSEAAQIGPRNFYNLNPYLTLELAEGLELITDINFLWRYSLEDGVYGPPGNLLFAPEGSNERFVSRAISFNLEYQITSDLFVGALYTNARPGAFIEDVFEEAHTLDFVELTLRYDF